MTERLGSMAGRVVSSSNSSVSNSSVSNSNTSGDYVNSISDNSLQGVLTRSPSQKPRKTTTNYGTGSNTGFRFDAFVRTT